jgi:uncharacterized OsmC-like protein
MTGDSAPGISGARLLLDDCLKEIVSEQLEVLSRRTPATAARPIAVVNLRAVHNLQIRATVEGHSFLSDERGHGGFDAAPAPLRYFLAGLGMCHLVWCIKSAAEIGIAVSRLEGQVSGYIGPVDTNEPFDLAQGFTRLVHEIVFDSDASAHEIRNVVHLAARRCTAFATLSKAVPIDLEVVHNGSRL